MNIFAVDYNPHISAKQIPDRYLSRTIFNMCYMISIVYSKSYNNWGRLYRPNGTSYDIKKESFKNHPCTIWLSKSNENLAWGYCLWNCFNYRI
jgi:hypothetical protein